jgi:hypothetical protein
MTCKVVRLIDRDRLVLLHISGHLQEMHINMIDDLLTKETDPVALDLGSFLQPSMRGVLDSEIARGSFASGCASCSGGTDPHNSVDVMRKLRKGLF